MLARTAVLREAGGYDQATVPAEDYDLWLRLLPARRIARLPEALYTVRVHAASSSAVGRAAQLARVIEAKLRYVRRWSLFVSLSADEGQGLAVLEAMALGVPVAARSVAGVEDFLADGHTGWALPDRGIAATASVLKRALEAPEAAAITRRARRMVERRYDWSTMVGAFDRLYRPSR